ncbi:protein-methionine-sulfoxide reductase catalytic subunit MsrP [Chloroflexota bacterium]
MVKINSSEITPEHLYLSRRRFIKGMGALAASSLVLATCGPSPESTATAVLDPTADPTAGATGMPSVVPTSMSSGIPPFSGGTDELGTEVTGFEAITHYNNYYEFTTDKGKVAELSKDFRTSPWQVAVGGLVAKPRTFDMDDLMGFTQEERIYRLRCVEAWSMVIPWVGFPLAKLLQEVEPESSAKYVRFETLYDPEQMPGQQRGPYDWPYVEGLRLDEAMNDLAILATGLYGKTLLPQSGAPVRMVLPWKYGFKSIKSIVKIDLVEEMPQTLWRAAGPREYGFYANVNPDVPHPRWSQATERRIGKGDRAPTLLFNGYGEEVAHLYDDLSNPEWYY